MQSYDKITVMEGILFIVYYVLLFGAGAGWGLDEGGFCRVLVLLSRKVEEVADTEMREKSLFHWRNY